MVMPKGKDGLFIRNKGSFNFRYKDESGIWRERNRCDGWNPTSHQTGWAYSWRKLRQIAGLPRIEFYSLRHTSITAGSEQNVPLAVMKSLAGRMDNKMTDYYTGIRDNPKVLAVKAIESANPHLLVLMGIESGADGKIQ